MVSELAIWLALQAPKAPPAQDFWIDLLKLIIPALGAYLLAVLQGRKDQRIAKTSVEESTRLALAAQQERLTGSWESLTAQARETVARAYSDAAEATVARRTEEAARRAAEQRALSLEAELDNLRIKYNNAIAKLERLERQAPRRRPKE